MPVSRVVSSPGNVSIVDSTAAHVAGGRFAEALAAVDEALRAAPNDPELLFVKGSTLFDWGRAREALAWYLLARGCGCARRSLAAQLGWCYFQLGDLAGAEDWARRATVSEPDSASGFYCLGLALRAGRRLDAAIAALEAGLAQNAADIHLLVLLSGCHRDRGELKRAEETARLAINVLESSPAAWSALGATLERQNRYGEALTVSEEAWSRELKSSETMDCFVGLSHVLLILGRDPDVLALCEQQLPRRPSVVGHSNYSFALLSSGRFNEGWWHYEFRWLGDAQRPARPRFVRPIWDGQDIRGKTVLLRPEQGVGDIVQFVRYAPFVKALGATVLLQIRSGLERFASSFPGIDRLVTAADEELEFDFHVALMSLPRVFGTELCSIPSAVPYMHADPGLVERWAIRLDGAQGLKVGLVWAGNPDHVNDRNRSIPLRSLGPIFGKAGASYYALQVGRGTEELAGATALEIEALGSELKDYTDTAALIEALDLLICVDTSVAHLAAALGKEVWVLLPAPADWRWLRDREDSPWYPTMRLFRQQVPGRWSDVIERVAVALEERILNGPASVPTHRVDTSNLETAAVPCEYRWPPAGHRSGFSAVAETRMGIVQYLPDETDVGLSIGYCGELLHQQIVLLNTLLKPGMTVLEAGAGCGAHALALSPILGPAGHLMLCESEPLLHRILRQNLAANGIVNATIMPRPLGRPVCTIPFGARTVDESNRSHAPETFDFVDGLRLEQLALLKCGMGVDRLDVLAGAEDTLWRLRPWLFLATSNQDEEDALRAHVELRGYRCWKMSVPWFDRENFNRRDRDLFNARQATALVAFPEEVDVDVALPGCREL